MTYQRKIQSSQNQKKKKKNETENLRKIKRIAWPWLGSRPSGRSPRWKRRSGHWVEAEAGKVENLREGVALPWRSMDLRWSAYGERMEWIFIFPTNKVGMLSNKEKKTINKNNGLGAKLLGSGGSKYIRLGPSYRAHLYFRPDLNIFLVQSELKPEIPTWKWA